jgi:hypothetical protein
MANFSQSGFMRPVTRGAWRSVRCLLLVICAGGILAADDTWVSAISFSFVKPSHWFSSTAAGAEADLPAAMTVPVDLAPRARISMGGLLHGLLFDRPAGRWALSSRAAEASSSLPRRLVEFEQINAVFGGNNSFAYQSTTSFAPIVAAPSRLITPAELSPTGPSAVTASGNWISNASGNWGTAANWQGGVIADGAGNNADFSTLNITSDVTVTLDSSRTIGSLTVGDLDGTHRYTIAPSGGSILTFDNVSNRPVLQQSATSTGDTISVPILTKSDLDINNLSSNTLTISGSIASSSTNFTDFVSINGNVHVSGNISNGTTGSSVYVLATGGTVTLSGTNTYTGASEADGGTLLINGNNSGATGFVSVYDTGTLGGTGTVGGSVFTFGGTITGGTATTVGTLTLLGNVNLSTGEGDGGTYLANLSGNLSDLLAISGNFVLGFDTTLNIVGSADGVTTYTLATFGSRDDFFDTVMGIPGGYDLVYSDTNIQLVPTPIPEPSTWIGGALALAALGWISRRRLWGRARGA